MKFLQAYLIFLITIIKFTYGLSVENTEEKSSISYLSIDKSFKLSNGPIYASGWLKFNKSLKDQTGNNIGFVKNKRIKISSAEI